MMAKALDLLTSPKTPRELAGALGLSLEATLLLLQQLERRGYVQSLPCATSCGACAFRNLCPGPSETSWIRVPGKLPLGPTP